MQPNEQNHNRSEAPSALPVGGTGSPAPQPPTQPPEQPLPYAAPDYLHLDPVSIQAARPTRKAKFVVAITALLVLVGAGGAAAFLWTSGASERGLYHALNNFMNLQYVSRTVVQTSQDPTSKISAQSQTDFTDPGNAKNQTEYTLSYPLDDRTKQFRLSEEVRMLDDSTLFFRLKEFPKSPLTETLSATQWYSLPLSNEKAGLFDPLEMSRSYTTLPEGLIAGDIGINARDQLVDYMKQQKVYTLEGSETATFDGIQAIVYNVKTDTTKIAAMYKKAADLGVKSIPNDYGTPKATLDYKIWVDKTTSRIVRVIINKKTTDTDRTSTSETEITYPSELSITEPDAKSAVQ